MKKLLLSVSMFTYSTLCAQNIIIQQNNQPYQREKVIIKEKEVPVYIEPQSTELTKPVLIYGYLYVYPVDLGRFSTSEFPYQAIQGINRSNAFGRNNWRLPTKDEWAMMEQANGDRDNRYDNGKLRLKGLYYPSGHIRCRDANHYMIQDSNGCPVKYDPYGSGKDYQQLVRLVSTY